MEEKKQVPSDIKQEPEKKKPCMVCGRPSAASICKECEAKIRGEALEHKQEIEKAGRK